MLVFAAVLAVLVLGVAFSEGEAAPAPALTIESTAPLVVRGTGFRTGERVTLTAATGLAPRTVVVHAVRGRFRASLSTAPTGCGAARFVRAKGTMGSVAFAQVPNAGVCIPPPRR